MDKVFATAACLVCTLIGCSSSSGEECPPTALCNAPALDAASHVSNTPADAGRDSSLGTNADAGARRDATAPDHVCGQYDALCPPLCPERLVLTGGTRNLGHCDGDCGFNLSFEFVQSPDTKECVRVFANLIIHNSDGTGRMARARLTQDAWDRLTAISGDLEHAAIEPAPTCADCVGKESVRLRPADAMQGMLSVEHEYPRGMPPAALRAADAFEQALIDQLVACRGSLIESCEVAPYPAS